MPAALSTLYTSQAAVEDLLSSEGVSLRLDDDQSGAVAAGELDRLTTHAVNYATAEVNMRVGGRYAPAQLAESWVVYEWATVIAARWLCARRANPVPTTIQDAFDKALEDMLLVQERKLSLNDIAERAAPQPTLSNMTLDSRYRVKQLRVQRPLSTPRPSVIRNPDHLPSTIIGGQEQ